MKPSVDSKNVGDTLRREGRGTHFYGLLLTELVTMSALGVTDEKRFELDLRRRQVELLTALTNTQNTRITHELRIVSSPCPETPARGWIDLFLFGRLDDSTVAETEWYAAVLSRMLASQFPEYRFETLSPARLSSELTPFVPAHAAMLTRRVTEENVASFVVPSKVRQRAGFHVGSEASQVPGSTGSIVHIFPFLPAFVSFSTFYRLLRLEPARIGISVTLRPTTCRYHRSR